MTSYWLYGLSAAGKTTIGNAIAKVLPCVRLDGDILRSRVCADLGYGPSDRAVNIDRAIAIASWEEQTVVATFMTPVSDMRKSIKERIPGIVIVFVKCPIEVCKHRDPKGLYASRDDMIEHISETGADITVDTSKLTVEECVQKIIGHNCAHCKCAVGNKCLCSCHYR